MTRPRAFTLIELAVVLAILGIAAGAVAMRVRGPMNRSRLRRVVEAVGQFDATTRIAARNQDRPMRLLVDLSKGRISRTATDGEPLATSELTIPAGVKLGKVIVRDQQAYSGSTSIACGRQGWTPSYALRLDGAGDRCWLLFAGMTGEMMTVDDEQQAQDILAAAHKNASQSRANAR